MALGDPEDPYGQPGNPLDAPEPEDDQAEPGEADGEGAGSEPPRSGGGGRA